MARKDVNVQILLGGLGRDAEQRVVEDGTLFKLRMATSRTYVSRGESKVRTEWHNVAYFAQSAPQIEFLTKVLVKGATVHVMGETRHESYAHEGQTKFATTVYAHDLSVVTSPALEARSEPDRPTGASAPAATARAPVSGLDPDKYYNFGG